VEEFKPTFIEEMGLDHYNLLYKEEPIVFDRINKRRLIFEVMSKILDRFLKLYKDKKPNVFYRVVETYLINDYNKSSNKPFSIIQIKVEF
jgi:hypothetical protein